MKHLKEIKDWNELKNEVVCGDSLELMRMISDNAIDLCLTDPPYGIGVDKTMKKQAGTKYGKAAAQKSDYGSSDWDSFTPSKEYFDEIRRISKNQIIFGGNYFIECLTNSPCWIVWDKNNGDNGFADCELAWTSFKSAVRMFKFTWNGMIQENMGKNKEVRQHPTQKPLELMKWCIANYVEWKPDNPKPIICDPFAGSFTTARACKDMGFDWIAIDQEEKYCEIGEKRLQQQVMF